MMAQSCYDPEAAIVLYAFPMSKARSLVDLTRWQRMERAQQVAIPQFLSTHPSVSYLLLRAQEGG